MVLIVGLGNPGHRYAETRHSIGFRVLDRLSQHFGVRWKRVDAGAVQLTEIRQGPVTAILAKPQRFMNRSGSPVARLLRRYRLPPTHLWVVVDDVDLPFGSIRLRPKGSAGGHHGLEAIIDRISSTTFPRLRLGIGPGRKPAGFDAAPYVLHPFSPDERRHLPAVIDRAVDALQLALERGFPAAMNVWNRKGAARYRP